MAEVLYYNGTDFDRRMRDLGLTEKGEPVIARTTLPESEEVRAHRMQMETDRLHEEALVMDAQFDATEDAAYAENERFDQGRGRVYRDMYAEAAAENAAFERAHWSRGRHRLGAMGILAYAHPDINTPAEAVAQRVAFEERDTSAVNYLARFARETLVARWNVGARAVGRMASRFTGMFASQEATVVAVGRAQVPERPGSRFSDADLGFLRGLRNYNLAHDAKYRGMQLANG